MNSAETKVEKEIEIKISIVLERNGPHISSTYNYLKPPHFTPVIFYEMSVHEVFWIFGIP